MAQERAGRREGPTTASRGKSAAYGPPDPENTLFGGISPAVSRVRVPFRPLPRLFMPVEAVPKWVYDGWFPNDPNGQRAAIVHFAMTEHTTPAERAANDAYLAERAAHVAGTCKPRTCWWCASKVPTIKRGKGNAGQRKGAKRKRR